MITRVLAVSQGRHGPSWYPIVEIFTGCYPATSVGESSPRAAGFDPFGHWRLAAQRPVVPLAAMRLSASANRHAGVDIRVRGSGSGLNIMSTLSYGHFRQGGQAACPRNVGLCMVLLATAIGFGWAVDPRRQDVAEALLR
jgi:hypothetical protein